MEHKSFTMGRIIFILIFVVGLLSPGGMNVLADDGATPETPAEIEVVNVETPAPSEAVDGEHLVVVEEGVVEAESAAEVISVIAESGSVITDETGVELPMASAELAEVIASADPYIIRSSPHGDITYRFLYDCSAFTNSATEECVETPNPVQMAVNFAEPGETINIEANTYNETVQVSSHVIFNGIGGNAILDAFILMAGEDVTGSLNVFAPLIYVNNGARINDGLLLAQEDGTVYVAAGTYNEQIKIKKSVKLVGEGKNSTNVLYSGNLETSGSYDLSSIISVSGENTNAEISGFNIEGSGVSASTDQNSCIVYL